MMAHGDFPCCPVVDSGSDQRDSVDHWFGDWELTASESTSCLQRVVWSRGAGGLDTDTSREGSRLAGQINGHAESARSEIIADSRERLDFVPQFEPSPQPPSNTLDGVSGQEFGSDSHRSR